MFLYTPESVYQLDRAAVEQDGFSETELMQHAGARVWREVIFRWPSVSKVTIFAGSGNNGGDAFVVALCARASGVEIQMITMGDLARQSDTAKFYKQKWLDGGGQFEPWDGQELEGEIVIDGLLGIGIQRALDEDWQSLIECINQQDLPLVAIDIPSGLDGATGNPRPVALVADLTVTFIGVKTGHFLAQGQDHCGELVFDDLGISSAVRAGVSPALGEIEECLLPAPRLRDSHKYDYGHVLIVGGNDGMTGAVSLAAKAALRTGSGLVSALVHPAGCHALSVVPEVMTRSWDQLESLLPDASVILVGPGLGHDESAQAILSKITRASQPVIVDADALQPGFLKQLRSEQVIITPHPGEAARLLGQTSAGIQQDRILSCRELVEQFNCVAILKGSGSLVGSSEAIEINLRGHAGMATAGMGDVLAGMVASLVGQGMDSYQAARSAVLIHALSAEHFAQGADISGLIASDVVDAIPQVIKNIKND